MPQRLLASNFEIARSMAFSRLLPSRWPSRELRSMERPRSWREEERGRERRGRRRKRKGEEGRRRKRKGEEGRRRERKGEERGVRGEGEKEERWREKE